MSRNINSMFPMAVNSQGEIVDHPVTIITGNDHAIGRFMDVTDSRYADSEHDEQGEGYLFEWSDLFGISTNLIDATIEDVQDTNKLLSLIDNFLLSKNIPLKF